MRDYLVLIHNFGCVLKRGTHIFPAKVRIACQDPIDRVSASNHVQDISHHGACAADPRWYSCSYNGELMTQDQADRIARQFVSFLETGEAAPNLFSDDVFCDFTMPQWRLQAQGLKDVIGLRLHGHPGPGSVPRWRCSPTPDGLVMEVEERWTQNGKDWYCREMFWAKVKDDRICDLSVYCTGDWDQTRVEQHAKAVKLLRP